MSISFMIPRSASTTSSWRFSSHNSHRGYGLVPTTSLVHAHPPQDPREYLPHLQSLHDLPPLRREFKIDDQLGRRTKALTHLKDLGEFDEAASYVSKHSLYREALNMYQYDPVHLNEIMRLYADYLGSSNRHKEAAFGKPLAHLTRCAY